MVPYLIAGLIGAVAMGRTKPKTRVTKHECFGPRTGTVYVVEQIPTLGVCVVHAPDGTVALFERDQQTKKLTFTRGSGNPQTIAGMQSDMEDDRPKKKDGGK